ncbi:hypothetical protein RSOLAG22IIIB_01854 [Rhizoctonia solani]|uniref:Uncharacterized protein n=1 Tax=Rhizoctonia solani TaxID=456999 RepID=A0A0K6GBU1_9AGAM|nr:hypothetical protein RSOLAG22IIIB_01854 [Rhizoctonia solani]
MNSDKDDSPPPRDQEYVAQVNENTDLDNESYDDDDDVPTSRGMPNRSLAHGENKYHERDIEKVEIRRSQKGDTPDEGGHH